jgi:hypothetical protein
LCAQCRALEEGEKRDSGQDDEERDSHRRYLSLEAYSAKAG